MGIDRGILIALCLVVMASLANGEETKILRKTVRGEKVCMQGYECLYYSKYCCNQTISQVFDVSQFEELFSKRNMPTAHAVGFWDYHSFILASTYFQPLGFGTTGGKQMQMKEIAAFLGHVGAKTSCGYGVATGGPLAWGLCYNREMSPSQDYCDNSYKLTYPCTPGVDYYGRGALPIYWNYNYGAVGEALKIDLLNNPELLASNATLGFMSAMWKWMTPIKKSQPSPHEAFIGEWKPTKNDTLAKRVPGFGATMNILYGDSVCKEDTLNDMNNIISHYLHYLDLLGVGREQAGPHEVLSCEEQEAFNPVSKTDASS